MNISEVASLCRSLLNEHGYGHIPFEFDRGKVRIAATHFTGRPGVYGANRVTKVSMSQHYAVLLTEAEVREAMLHEIAHIKAGPESGHGAAFVLAARSLGIRGTRCMKPAQSPAGAWTGTCPKGHTTDMHKAPLRVRSCIKCSRGFRFENVFTWKKHGRAVPLEAMPTKYQQEFLRLRTRNLLTISG